jgi:hypothetical protein
MYHPFRKHMLISMHGWMPGGLNNNTKSFPGKRNKVKDMKT